MTIPLTGSNSEHTRLHNRRVVLGQIRQAGKLGRAELARNCSLSIQTISNIIAQLLTDELIKEDGQVSRGRGQPSPQYSINANGAHAIGFEVSTGSVTAALVDIMGNQLMTKHETLQAIEPEQVGQQLNRLMNQMSTEAQTSISTLLGAGVVMPGPFVRTGLANTVSVMPGWQDVDAHQVFRRSLELPVLIENDANAAALNERVSGSTNTLTNYAFIYFGTGIGLGVVHEGRLFRGAGGNAGEIGHISVPIPDASSGASPNASSAPLLTTLESVASRFALFKRLESFGIDANTTESLDTMMAHGNPYLLAWLKDAAAALSHAVHVIENLFDPETIMLGGALPDSVISALVKQISLASLSIAERENRKLPRVMCGISGQSSAAAGGAALVINQLYTPREATAL